MAARKRRIRSPHPGVVIKKRKLPSGGVGYRGRFEDPDLGREVDFRLDAATYPTREARTLWAKNKSEWLRARRAEIESGKSKIESRPIADAVESYFESAEHRLRGLTLRTYRVAVSTFGDWCERHGVHGTGQITRPKLAAFRDSLITKNKLSAHRGGKRGQVSASERKRSPLSVNRELRTIKTVLNAWRQAGLVPLDRDAVSDTLKALPVPREQPEYLTPTQIKQLVEAALRHDAAVYAETRAEHAGLRPIGTTRRYEPIAPFALFLLLTGCRRGEALALKWSDVDLDARDHEGRVVGEIRLRAEATKTKRARTIGLEVSPALRLMLVAMRLRAAADAQYVFGDTQAYTADLVESARARLLAEYDAPKFDWQVLRSTCATYLTNAPGIFGSATVFLSARQLGHSVAVAERHYLNVHRGIPRDARTLEAAMQIEPVLRERSDSLPSASAVWLRQEGAS